MIYECMNRRINIGTYDPHMVLDPIFAIYLKQ